jgi:hypothetical protein
MPASSCVSSSQSINDAISYSANTGFATNVMSAAQATQDKPRRRQKQSKKCGKGEETFGVLGWDMAWDAIE